MFFKNPSIHLRTFIDIYSFCALEVSNNSSKYKHYIWTVQTLAQHCQFHTLCFIVKRIKQLNFDLEYNVQPISYLSIYR